MRFVMRVAVAALMSMSAVMLVSQAASAHSSIVSTRPPADAVLDAVPASVVVTFDAPLMAMGSAMVVRGADGTVVSVGQPRVEGQRISINVDQTSAGGDYTVAFRVVSEDGHAVTSSYGFTVVDGGSTRASPTASKQPASPSPVGSASATVSDVVPAASAGEGGQVATPAVVAGVAVVGVLLVVAGMTWLRRRRST